MNTAGTVLVLPRERISLFIKVFLLWSGWDLTGNRWCHIHPPHSAHILSQTSHNLKPRLQRTHLRWRRPRRPLHSGRGCCRRLLPCCSTGTPQTPSCSPARPTPLPHPLWLAPHWAPGLLGSRWNYADAVGPPWQSPERPKRRSRHRGRASSGTARSGCWRPDAAGPGSTSGRWRWPPAGRCATGHLILDQIWAVKNQGRCFRSCTWTTAPRQSAEEGKQGSESPEQQDKKQATFNFLETGSPFQVMINEWPHYLQKAKLLNVDKSSYQLKITHYAEVWLILNIV